PLGSVAAGRERGVLPVEGARDVGALSSLHRAGWARRVCRRPAGVAAAESVLKLLGGPAARPPNCHAYSAAPAASAARATAGTAAAVAARAATSGATLWLRTRLVHDEVAIAKEPAIEHLHRLHRFFFRRHLNEAEAARAPGELIGDDPHGLHGSRLREELTQVLLRGLEGKVADEQLCRHRANLLPSLKAAR